MSKAIILYLHAHQPYRMRHYTILDVANDHNYYNDSNYDSNSNNERIIKKVSEKSYLPTNRILLDLLKNHENFKISLSITGDLIEQLEQYAPHVLDSFKEIVATGKVEILAETYYHSLAFFYSLSEFNAQVEAHHKKIQEVFGYVPKSFRNTELAYNNNLAVWADKEGYEAIITEGWNFLGWRSPNFIYKPVNTSNIKLLLKNYQLSDDIAFRFGDKNWQEWPLTTEKFVHWINSFENATNINLFMDYETFGEHQWESTGILEFLKKLPEEWLRFNDYTFMTINEAAKNFEAKDVIDVPNTVTWADTERDLSAWLGNPMQQQAINAVYELEESIVKCGDVELIHDWRKLQTSDHFYYMCTKWFSDGDIHAYFSPYDTPYEAFMNFMNIYHDLRFRLSQKGY